MTESFNNENNKFVATTFGLALSPNLPSGGSLLGHYKKLRHYFVVTTSFTQNFIKVSAT